MSQINVNLSSLEEKIEKLRTLSNTCEAIDASSKALSGSGLSIDALSLIDQQYPLLKKSISTLLLNSISFFENVKNSVVEADAEASSNIK